MAAVELRPLEAADIPAALELSSDAGWNQTPEDWRAMLDLAPEGCLALECDGKLAATTTLVSYGVQLAWIGMVLTRADCRRRGFATLLLRRALAIADKRGVATVKLDATEMGETLYASLGFEREEPIERWSRGEGVPCPGPIGGAPVSLELDRPAFGADRSLLLQALAQRSSVSGDADGYAFARDGRLARYLGPCVATNPASARRCIGRVLCDGPWFWDLLPDRAEAAALARAMGFAPVRRLARMRRGALLPCERNLVYAIAAFEFG